LVLDGYIRVSQVAGREGERFISPGLQREQISGWVRAHGATLANVYEEFDESGGRGDRPMLMEALERVEAGESDGVIVAKLDRFGRSVIDGLDAIRRIEQAGGTFVSVQDGFDLGTSTGRLVLQVLLSIGEWELRRVRATWDSARERAISRGVYIGQAPLGYRKDEGGRLRIDRREAALIGEVFRRRADGQAFFEITAWLNGRGAKTRLGYPFRTSTISKIVKNPAYRGEAYHGAYRNPDAHEAIVDAALWQLSQHTPHTRKARHERLLTGLVRCGSCGRVMSGNSVDKSASRFHVYSCTAYGGLCPGPAYARGDELDPLVEEFLFRRCGRAPTETRAEVRSCEAALTKAEKELASYRDEPSILETLGPSSFAEGLAARRARLERSLRKLAHARRAEELPVDVVALEQEWTELDGQQRWRALARLIDCVIVERGSATLLERVWLFRSGRAPVTRVRGKLVIASDSFGAEGERPSAHRRWSLARLEHELREFLGGREEWPTYHEFACAGRSRLFAQCLAQGGSYYWGHRLGLRVPSWGVRWNRERVRTALAPFLKQRTAWPGRHEFEEAGMAPVYNAAKEHGGISYWAKEFGCTNVRVHRLQWPEERIAEELAAFTAGRADFPRRSEFFAAGKRPLYTALSKRGGVAVWAKRLDLVQQRPGPAPSRREPAPLGAPPIPKAVPAPDSTERSGARALLQILHPLPA
jgi:DNA invertase Pin-like site-specific DNA recombinase